MNELRTNNGKNLTQSLLLFGWRSKKMRQKPSQKPPNMARRPMARGGEEGRSGPPAEGAPPTVPAAVPDGGYPWFATPAGEVAAAGVPRDRGRTLALVFPQDLGKPLVVVLLFESGVVGLPQ